MDAPSDQLPSLAHILNMRKRLSSKPYRLLLTSSLSFTPDKRKQICGTDDWLSFRLFLQQLGHTDRLLALISVLHPPRLHPGYQALARLIANGYFSLIFTTSPASDLDLALSETHVPIQHTLIAGRDTNEYITHILDNLNPLAPPPILKLQGSLRDNVLPDHFPDFFELNPEIARSVKYNLNQDLLIVGSLAHEQALERAMLRESKGSLYVVPLSESPIQQDDTLYQLIRARGDKPELRILSNISSLDLFFTSLEICIKNDLHQNLLPPISSQPPPPKIQPPKIQPPKEAPLLPPLPPSTNARSSSQPSHAFIDYNPSEKRFLDELHIHLDQYVKTGTIEYWDKTKLQLGTQRQIQIQQALQSVKVVILLISAAFLADTSPDRKQILSLLPSAAQNGTKILCIIARPCAFEDSELSQFPPINTKPLSLLTTAKREEIWQEVAKRVRDYL